MSEISDMLREECADRKRTARGAFNKKTHNGKGGRVKFPSDYLSKKEKEKMNGEVKTFKMNQPISWEEFKTYPDDIKRQYIRALRMRFQVPDKLIAEMMGVPKSTFGLWMQTLNMAVGKGHKPNFTDTMKTAWDNWRLQITHVKGEDEEVCEDLDKEATDAQMKLDEFEKPVDEPTLLRAHDIDFNDLEYRNNSSPEFIWTEKTELDKLKEENALLKAKLEMVYLIFGGERNDDD